MNILQINSARNYCGEAAHTLNLTEALRLKGHTVFLGLRGDERTLQWAEARKLDPIPFKLQKDWWTPQQWPDARKIARMVRDHKIDLIHVHRGKEHWLTVFANQLYRLRIPIVRTRHVVTPLSGNIANRWLARRTAKMVVVSTAIEKDVQRTGIYKPERLRFIPGGIDTNLYKPASPQQKNAWREKLGITEGLVVACVARFSVVKAQKTLIDAWKQVHAQIPTATLLLIGSGILQEPCKLQAESLGLGKSVRFLGNCTNVSELLSACDAGVLSSIGSEGFSRAVLEYMSEGLPVVGTRVGAVPDLVADNEHGFLVEPNNADSLAGGLLRLLSAPDETRKMWGAAARSKVESGYGYTSWVAAHERLYSEILAARKH